jgi:hypothetical protein
VAVVGRLEQKYERDSTKGETIHKTTQKQSKTQNTQNRKQKHIITKTNIKRILKKSSN